MYTSNAVSPKRSIGTFRRRAVSASSPVTYSVQPLYPDRPAPVLVRAQVSGLDLAGWVRKHSKVVDTMLREHGAVLLRGFSLGDVDDLPDLAEALVGPPLRYVFRSTPRTEVEKRVYTSTEYPADAHIPQHNENAYQPSWPLRLAFFCVIPAESGGETPIADMRRVLDRLSPELVARFEEHGVRYVRNYARDNTSGFDLPWPEVFQTDSRADVEAYCRAHGVEFSWGPDDRLRTWHCRPAVARHPHTQERLWFNQAHLFHPSALPEAVRASLLEVYREDELPRNAYLGDGTPLSEDDLSEIRAAIEAEKVGFPWQRHDAFLLDNMLVSHGRAPYRGARRILTSMGEPTSSEAGAAQ